MRKYIWRDIVRRAELHLNIPVYPRMALITTYFPTHSESLPCALLEIYKYQGILKSRSQFEKFRHNAAVPNIKYNCAVLFWGKCIA